MKVLLLLAALAAVAVVRGQQVEYTFNCNLQPVATRCNGNLNICNADGTCDCTPGNIGRGCTWTPVQLNLAPCTPTTCENGGTCYSAGATFTCECPAAWAGATCNVPRVDAVCDGGATPAVPLDVTFSIYTYSYFNPAGRIFVRGANNDSACESIGDGVNQALETLTVPHTSADCGDATQDAGNPNVFTRCLYLTHSGNNMVLPKSDYIICATCPNSDIVNKKSAIVTINGIEQGIDKIDIGGAADGDVSMVLRQNNVDLPDGQIVVFGSTLTVNFQVTDPGKAKGFTSLRVETCNFKNGNDSATELSMPLFTAACPDATIEYGLNVISREITKDEKEVDFNAFVWQYTPERDMIYLECGIKLCRVDGDCEMATCGAAQHIGRKKRQVDSGEYEEQSVVTNFQVVEKLSDLLKQKKTQQEKACYMTWQMTATIIALSVGLLLVLILCIILVVKTIYTRRGNQTIYRDESTVGSTTALPHLPTIVSNKC